MSFHFVAQVALFLDVASSLLKARFCSLSQASLRQEICLKPLAHGLSLAVTPSLSVKQALGRADLALKTSPFCFGF